MMIHKFLQTRTGPKKYFTPQDFLADAVRYFEWVDENPLQEELVFHARGLITRSQVDKMRPYTKQGLATFLGIPVSRLDSYKSRQEEGWAEAVEMIEQVIYEQKFSGAAAGLLNASIISRDLGLAEKTEVTGKTTVIIDGDEADL